MQSFSLLKGDSHKKGNCISETVGSTQQWLIDLENTFSLKVLNLTVFSSSFLSGMLNVKCHVECFKDTASTNNVAKVSLTYKRAMIYKKVTEDTLLNLDHKNLLIGDELDDEFTHVIVAVQYGKE